MLLLVYFINVGIKSMEDNFNALVQSTFLELIEKEVDIEDVPFLPQVLRARKFGRNASNVKKIFEYLDAYIWTFIDHGILSTIIDRHGSDQLKESLEQYVQDLHLFEQHTTASQLMESWPGRKHIPHSDVQSDITIRIHKDPDTCSLEQLRHLRKEFCDQFLLPKSELIVLYESFTHGSLVMKLFIPLDFVPDLIDNVIKHGNSFFVDHEIESFQVREVLIYQSPKSVPGKWLWNKW